MKKFNDSATMPIIAIDFDDTININGADKYPVCGKVRPYAKEVINFMHKLGIKVVIWTSRDVAYNQDERKLYNHLTPMIEWLNKNKIHYDAINKSIQFAPYAYNGRKVYAHMYIDDRAFGWYGADDGKDTIFLDVLEVFLMKVCGFRRMDANIAVEHCRCGLDPAKWMIEGVKNWRIRL